jgi:hypothetical protein
MRPLTRLALATVAIALALGVAYNAIRLVAGWNHVRAATSLKDAGFVLLCGTGLVLVHRLWRGEQDDASARLRARLAHGFRGNGYVAKARTTWLVLTFGLILPLLSVLAYVMLLPPNPPREFFIAGTLMLSIAFALVAIGPYALERPALAMDASGVRHVFFAHMPWDQVYGVHRRVVDAGRGAPQQILVLGVHAPDRFVPRWRRLWRQPRAHGDLVVPLNILDDAAEAVEQAALALRDRVQPPRYSSWGPGIPPKVLQATRAVEDGVAELQRLLNRLEEASTRAASADPRVKAKGEADGAALTAELDRFMASQSAHTQAVVDWVNRRRP